MKGIKWVIILGMSFFVLSSISYAEKKSTKKIEEYGFCPRAEADYTEDFGKNVLGDLLPWPLGSECSIPWKKLGGTWIRPKDQELGKFSIEVMDSVDNYHIVVARKYDKAGTIVEEGSALTLIKDKVIEIKMLSTDPSKEGYTLFIRHYAEEGTCAQGTLATVLTIRKSQKGCEDDVSFIMKKAPKDKGLGD